MQHVLEEKQNYDHCPNCDMPLEDSEACNFCEWKSIDLGEVKGKENEKSIN